MEVDSGDTTESPLLCACRQGDVRSVAALLTGGNCSIETADAEGTTPLLAACNAGHLDLVQFLLQAAAAPDAVDSEGRGLGLLAAESGSVPLLQWLLEQGQASLADCAEDGTTLLLSAAAGGSPEMVEWLLNLPGDTCSAPPPSLQECDSRGASCVLVAAENGALPVLGLLQRLKYHAVVTGPDSNSHRHLAAFNDIDDNGCGIFHYAAAGGHVAVAEFCLRELGLRCDVRDYDGDTPLLVAAHEGHVEVVRWLLANGSSLWERNTAGISVGMAAAAGERREVLEFLGQRAGSEELWLLDFDRHPALLLNFLEKGLH